MCYVYLYMYVCTRVQVPLETKWCVKSQEQEGPAVVSHSAWMLRTEHESPVRAVVSALKGSVAALASV